MISMRTPEHYRRHPHTIIMHYQELYYIKCVSHTALAEPKQNRAGEQQRDLLRHQKGAVPGGTQRVGRIFVETLELQKNERSLVADPAIASPRSVSRPREPSTWLRNGRYFDSFF